MSLVLVYNNLTRAAITATATESMVPIFMVKRSSNSFKSRLVEILSTVAIVVPSEVNLVDCQSNLTNTATMPIAKATSAPSLIIRRCSSSRISRRTSSMSRLVAKSASPCASLNASENASAWLSGTPASFKVRMNLWVSKVIVAIVVPSQFTFKHSLAQGFTK